MKFFLVVLVCVLLSLSMVSMAAAHTMDVEVSPGASFTVEQDFHGDDDWRIIGEVGVSDQCRLHLGYEDNIEAWSFGGRIELMKGRALLFDYMMVDNFDQFNIALRERTDLDQTFAVIGELKFGNSRTTFAGTTTSRTAWTYTIELSQHLNDRWTGNLDMGANYSQGDWDFLGGFGADFKAASGLDLYFDYRIYPDSIDNILTVGAKFEL